jgi:hypothetical protein
MTVDTIAVSGIRLVTVGKPGASDEMLEVHAEVDGQWRCVIQELKDGPISHIVETNGIKTAPMVN